MGEVVKSLAIAGITGIVAGYLSSAVTIARLETEMVWIKTTLQKTDTRITRLEDRTYDHYDSTRN